MNKTRFTHFLIGLAVLVLTAVLWSSFRPAAAADATDVPRGGVVVDLGAGGNTVSLRLKNTTGRSAKDVTVTIYKDDGTAVPNITEMDIPTFNSDSADDNNNGSLEEGENDNSLAPPATTGRLIISGGTGISRNGEVELNITLDGNTTPGTKMKVRFSYESNGRHYDLCAAWPLDGQTAVLSVPHGSHLCSLELTNDTQDQVTDVSLLLLSSMPNAFIAAEAAPPYDNSQVTVMTELVTLTLDPPLLPGTAVDLNLVLENAPTDDLSTSLLVQPVLQSLQNGRYVVADESLVRLLDLDGNVLDLALAPTGPADVVTDGDRIIVIDDNSVRIYDRNGQQQGLTITTTGRASVQVEGDRIIVIDDDSVRIFDTAGSQQGLTISTNGRADVVTNDDCPCIIVIDDDSVRIYDRNGVQQGLTISTTGRAAVQVEGDRIVVIDDNSVRIFDCHGNQQGLTINTNGRADVIVTPTNVIVIDDNSVRIYDRDGQQQGLTIPTTGRADVVTDGNRIVVIDDDSVRIFDTAGSQQGLTIGANGRAAVLFTGERIIVIDDNSVRIYDRDGGQKGLTIPTQGRADVAPAFERLAVIDDDSVEIYHVNGFLQGAPLPTAGRAKVAVLDDAATFAIYLPLVTTN